MRVMLCHQPTDGGVGRHIRDLVEGLHTRGHQVALASPAIPQGTPEAVAHRSLDLRRAIAPGADLAALIHAAAIVRDVRPDVIHNGMAPAREGPVDPRMAALARRGPVIGALTLLRPGKGVETLIAAVPHVLTAHPDVQVAIVGEGPHLDELAALARKLGVGA